MSSTGAVPVPDVVLLWTEEGVPVLPDGRARRDVAIFKLLSHSHSHSLALLPKTRLFW